MVAITTALYVFLAAGIFCTGMAVGLMISSHKED